MSSDENLGENILISLHRVLEYFYLKELEMKADDMSLFLILCVLRTLTVLLSFVFFLLFLKFTHILNIF